jgi:hypothetical protein
VLPPAPPVVPPAPPVAPPAPPVEPPAPPVAPPAPPVALPPAPELDPPLPDEPPVIDVSPDRVPPVPALSLEQAVSAKRVALPATTTIEVFIVVRIGQRPFEVRASSAAPRAKAIMINGRSRQT